MNKLHPDETGRMNFYMEITQHQLTANEFFCREMLLSMDRNLGLTDAVISYFDTEGRFLSWVTRDGLMTDRPDHPYRQIINNDVVRYRIYQDAVRDRLDYFNIEPRLYRATDIIGAEEYDQAAYTRFLKSCFGTHYSTTLAFGINGYIQITFMKHEEEGDFTDHEMDALAKVYVYIANGYRTFKKYEQARIISKIQNIVIREKERAFCIADDFNHVLDCNDLAAEYIRDLFGEDISTAMKSDAHLCSWLAFFFQRGEGSDGDVSIKRIRNYSIRIHTYDQSYSNGIADRYRWITFQRTRQERSQEAANTGLYPLTAAEQRVADLLYKGLTYREIAGQLIISYHTVKKHVQNIYKKCGVTSRYQLINWIEAKEKE